MVRGTFTGHRNKYNEKERSESETFIVEKSVKNAFAIEMEFA